MLQIFAIPRDLVTTGVAWYPVSPTSTVEGFAEQIH